MSSESASLGVVVGVDESPGAKRAWADADVSDRRGMNWPTTESMAQEALAKRWPAGRNDIPMSAWIASSCATGRHSNWSSGPKMPNWLWWAAAAVVNSPNCWWVLSARPLARWRGCQQLWRVNHRPSPSWLDSAEAVSQLIANDEHRALRMAEKRMSSRTDKARELIGLRRTDHREPYSFTIHP